MPRCGFGAPGSPKRVQPGWGWWRRAGAASARSPRQRRRRSCMTRCTPCPKTAPRGGRRARWPPATESARTPCGASGTSRACARGAPTRSSCRPTPTSRPSSPTWWACTWTPRSGPWCSASTRRPSARPSTAPAVDAHQTRPGPNDDPRLPPPRRHRSVRALDVATGEVFHQTRRRHTGRDVLAFFKWIDLHTPGTSTSTSCSTTSQPTNPSPCEPDSPIPSASADTCTSSPPPRRGSIFEGLDREPGPP